LQKNKSADDCTQRYYAIRQSRKGTPVVPSLARLFDSGPGLDALQPCRLKMNSVHMNLFEAEDMDCYRVSPLVNNVRNNSPECLPHKLKNSGQNPTAGVSNY